MSSKSIFQLLSLSAIWSGYYLCTKYLNSFVSTFASGVAVRVVTILSLILFLALKGRLSALHAPKGARPRLILVGVLCFVLDITAFVGFAYCPASVGSALLKCDILFVNLLAYFVSRRIPTKKEWFFTILMLAGVFVLLDINYTEIRSTNAYSLLFLVSAFTVSCNAYLVQSVQKKYPGIDDMAIALYNLLFSGLCFLAMCVFSNLLGDIKTIACTPRFLTVALAGGILDVALFIIYYKSLREFSVWFVKSILLTMPVFTAAISYFVFDEILNFKQIIGIVVICLGAVLILNDQSKNSAKQKA